MKVVQINAVCGYGSTGKIAVDISKALSSSGIENYILYGVGRSDYPPGIKFSNDLYLKSNILKTRLFGKHGFYSHFATLKLIKILKRIDPDIIHLHNIHGHYLNVRILFKYLKRSNKKVFWTLHDCWSITGHCSHFEYIGCEKWKQGCIDCDQLREYPVSLIFDRSRESYKDKKRIFTGLENLTIITPSDWLNRIIHQSYLSDYNIVTINNGIDLSVFKPVESDIKTQLGIQNKKMLLAVSMGFIERKGYSYYLKLAKMLDDNYIIVMVGVSKAQINELPDNIIGISQTSNREELIKLYTAADVFVNMTLEDTFPTVNIESLACGTPVVTWQVGGSPEIISETTGITVSRFDVEGVCKAVKHIAENKISQDECIRRASELYDKSLMIDKYMKLYRGE